MLFISVLLNTNNLEQLKIKDDKNMKVNSSQNQTRAVIVFANKNNTRQRLSITRAMQK